MSIEDNKKHHFNPVPKVQWVSVWEKIVTDQCPLKVWEKNQEKDAKDFSIKNYDEKHNVLTIYQKSTLINIFDQTKALNDQVILIKVNWANLQFFGSGVFHITNVKDEYQITLKSELFQCQQRSFLRLSINSGVPIKMKYMDKVYDLFDISGGGLSLILPASVDLKFTKGQEIIDLKVKVGSEQFNINKAQIVAVSDDGNRLKMAMKFLDLSENQLQDLLRKINIEARGAIILSQLNNEKKKAS